MFARLFGRNANSLHSTKSIDQPDDKSVPQNHWTALLVNLDLKLSLYHDQTDLILLSSPYSVADVSRSLNASLDRLSLSYVAPLVMQYLYCDEQALQEKLQFVTGIDMEEIKELMQHMAIIFIDISSSEMITIPTSVQNLFSANSRNNKHKSPNDGYQHWLLRWSTKDDVTCFNFRTAMDEICDTIKTDVNVSAFFRIYTGRPPVRIEDSIQALRNAVAQLDRRELHVEKKIAHCLSEAKRKHKNGDKKAAMFELKKKKELERQLEGLAGKKLGIETQIMCLEDHVLNTSEPPRIACGAHQRIRRCSEEGPMEDVMDCIPDDQMDCVTEIQQALSAPLSNDVDDDELAELEAMMNEETGVLQKPETVRLDPAPLASNTDDELAELEEMMK